MECYTLIYEAKAPVHIGMRTLGIVNRTRYYILGRNFWGATTAMLARRIMKKYDPKIYEKVGEFVRKNIIFTHFFPYDAQNDSQNDILYPHYEQGLKYGPLSEGQFESRFISSYVSTALEKSHKSAEDESLHEIEFIRPHYERDGEIENTKFFGHIFISKNPGFSKDIEEIKNELQEYVSWKNLKESISELWVGGERNYGFGRIHLLKTPAETNPRVFNKYKVDLNTLKIEFGEEPITALSHVKFDSRFISIKGDIEPLLGREWDQGKGGTGHKISEAVIYLTPGTEFEKEENIEIKIDDFGTWIVKD